MTKPKGGVGNRARHAIDEHIPDRSADFHEHEVGMDMQQASSDADYAMYRRGWLLADIEEDNE